MKHILFAALMFCSSLALADGKTSLKVFGSGGSIDAVYSNNQVTGKIFGFGGTMGDLNLAKDGDLWKGRYGMSTVEVTKAESSEGGTLAEGKTMKLEIKTFPGGWHNYTVRMDKKGNYVVNGTNSSFDMVSYGVAKDGKSIYGGNSYTSISLYQDKKDMTYYSGYLHIQNPWGGFPISRPMDLKAEGDLSPLTLVSNDPMLYVMLYVVPFNLTR